MTTQPLSPHIQAAQPLRRATLVHRAEAFLLEALTAGHSVDEIESGLRQALDQWRSVEHRLSAAPENTLRFAGSHDLTVAWLASHFSDIVLEYSLCVSYSGSLGGLMALAAGEADIAGCHLWDEETQTYNVPYVRRLFPGRRIPLVTLARRRVGLVLPPGNPLELRGLRDLCRQNVRFVNRQIGSGTRVWLDIELRKAGLSSTAISGYERQVATHSEVAGLVAEGEADAGIALEGSALAYGLDFLPLTVEVYDLAVIDLDAPGIAELIAWLVTPEAAEVVASFGGYLAEQTGRVHWVE